MDTMIVGPCWFVGILVRGALSIFLLTFTANQPRAARALGAPSRFRCGNSFGETSAARQHPPGRATPSQTSYGHLGKSSISCPAAPPPQQPTPNPAHLPQFVHVNAALPVAMPQPAGGGGAAANGQPPGVAYYAWYEVTPGPHPLSTFPGPHTRIRRRIGLRDFRQGPAA